MVSVTTLLHLVWLGFANAQLDAFTKINAPFKISPVDYLKSHFIQPGYVNGARDCGVAGQILQFTHTNCVPALPAVACLGEIDKPSHGDMYFVAAQDASAVLVRASIITSEGKIRSADLPIPDTTLRAGQPYVLHAAATIEPELLGKLFTGRIEILRASDKSVQACSEIDFIGYKP